MKNIKKLLACLGVTVACLAGISQSAYAAVAGHVQFVSGNVEITNPAGQTRQAQKGDAVSEGDTLTSAPSASAQIKMQDGGFVAVRPDTKLKFDQFVFVGKQDGSEKSFFSLFKGGFRAVTGLIGQVNKQNYKITTPAATIGIRGTDHETFMIAPDSPLAQVAPTGAYSKVNVGETYMATEKGTIFVQPNQMGFAGGMNQAPQLQPLNTNIFTVAAAPAAGAKVEKKEEKKESGESKQDKQAANGKDGNGKDGEKGKKSDDTAPVRESAVVDATPPAAGTIPATTSPVVGATATTAGLVAPVVTIPPPLVVVAGTQVINVANQTIVPVAGGAAVPITGNNPAYAAQNGYGFEALGVDALGAWINPWDSNLPGTSYLLDVANNLVEVVGGINPGKVAGGVALDTYKSADSSVYFGRWQGGTYTPTLTLVPVAMGATSMQWMVSANPPAGYVQTLAGITNYSLTAATHPTDKLGNVGTLSAATLSADFTTQLVNISLALAFSTADPTFISAQNKAFAVTTPNGIPIFGETIWGLGTVACVGANCDAGYTADIWARFAANAADKVAIPYNIVGNATDLVQGVALVAAATPPVAPAPAVTVAPYVQTDMAMAFVTSSTNYLSPFAVINTIIAKPADINNALPNPSFTDRYAGKDPASYITNTLSGTTTVGETTTVVGNGIQYGRYNSTQATQLVVGTTNCCAAGTTLTPAPVFMHWIAGPAVDLVYLPEILLTANPAAPTVYTFFGGTTPTDAFLAASTLNSGALSVDFTRQLVAFSLALTVGGAPWTASTTGTPLQMLYWNGAKVGFRATTVARPGWGALTVTGATSGDVVGQLTGSGLSGAMLSYYLASGGASQVSGVVAFTGTPLVAPSYRIVGLSTAEVVPAGQANVGLTVPVTTGGYNNAASVIGNLTQFNGDQPFSNGLGRVINIGTAIQAGLGTDPVSGISWGRWVGGSLSATDLATVPLPAIANPSSAHWIASPILTGPVTLPVTGVFNYVLAGGTQPTDSLGGIGTLNSASLSANFTAQTVTVGLNVTTPNAGNLIASAANLPIEQKSFFNAATAGAVNGGGAPGSLTVTCGAGCAGTPQGHLGGAFAGPGGIGAALLYGFSAGLTNTTIVNGVAAFHR